jgi:hypothetical protein
MFGHQDDQSQPQANEIDTTEAVNALPPTDTANQAAAPVPSDDSSWQHPGTPVDPLADEPVDVVSPAGGFPKAPSFTPGGEPEPVLVSGNPALVDDSTNQELSDIKQHALTELLPLIDKLDLSPADRFKTLLMMIQASDDPHLIKAAYESAHKIEDEKVRAQALLDIVNEINYFTQGSTSSK